MFLQVVAGSGDRGWLDGSLEHQNWLKLIQTSSGRKTANMKYYLQGGQVCLSSIFGKFKCFLLNS